MTASRALASGVLVLLLARLAFAANPPGDIVIDIEGTDGDPATTAAARRLAAELALLGLSARLAPARSAAPPMTDDAPRARIVLDVGHGKVDVAFFDALSGRLTMHQVLDVAPTADLAALLVVRTVELVRAVLLPARAETSVAVASPPVAVVSPPPARPGARASLALASGALLTPGGAGATVTLALAARLRVAGPLGVELSAFAPLTGQDTSTLEGRGTVTTWLAGAGVFARSAPRRLVLDGAAGALLLWLRTDGTPAPSFAATGASTVGAAAYARAGASLTLGPQLAARLDVYGGGVTRRPVLAFPDSGLRPAWGRTFAAALAGLEARWF